MRIAHAATAVTSALTLALAPVAAAAPPSDAPEVPVGDIAKTGGANRTKGGRDGDKTADLRDSVRGRNAKNVILLIGDGMGHRRSPRRATISTVPLGHYRDWTHCRSPASTPRTH
ncbi:alkaline phosphatase [Mycobacteroides abscessus subsp. massiliense]|nr:alkaline phosphatase [Mycobacteroides abscessus subsp. massiliense]SKH86859.1 alkaline phosphatase [Mycobacteroides abscessus subsp. massiliense]SKI10214.1 alkaline phosphatase [Mycobacteroides abscessus subsp. massiliense]SKK24685.1 alkaline phosphatase [Mycobacteroides abscessus subsp. massiliense]